MRSLCLPALLLVGLATAAPAADDDELSSVNLLQGKIRLAAPPEPAAAKAKPGSLAYVPVNFFGKAALPPELSAPDPELDQISQVTGCTMRRTPSKDWPADMAQKYFGNRTAAGVLQDPISRLRQRFEEVGAAQFPEAFAKNDVNEGIQQMIKEYISSYNPYEHDCSLLPQAEYFDGPYGISAVADGRRFPDSLNEILVSHGFEQHVTVNHDVEVQRRTNATGISRETLILVGHMYENDLKLMCEKLGDCEFQFEPCVGPYPGKWCNWKHDKDQFDSVF